MHPRVCVQVLGSLIALQAAAFGQAQSPAQGGFWVGTELGFGSATVSTSVGSHTKGGLAMGLEGGYAFNPTVAVGLRLSGYSLEASNMNDPTKGESISLVAALVRVHPWSGRGLFLRAGAGPLRYTTNHPLEWGGSGTGLFLGAGWDFPLWKRLRIAPVVDFTQGKFGDVDNALVTVRDRRCRIVSFGVSLTFS